MQPEAAPITWCHRICFLCEFVFREEAGFTTFLNHLRHMQLSMLQTEEIFCNGLFVKLVVTS